MKRSIRQMKCQGLISRSFFYFTTYENDHLKFKNVSLHHVQMYYTGKMSSPVYALAFDTARLYVALDKGINMLDFSLR